MARWAVGGGGGSSAPASIVAGLSPSTSAGAANASLIQAALDAAVAAGGGDVVIPVGEWTTAPLKLRTRVRLAGLGWGSRLKLAASSNAHLLSLYDISTEQTLIEDIWLDANAANQSAGNWDAVNLDNTGYSDALAYPSLGDPNHAMNHVSIFGAKRHGLYVGGGLSGSQFKSVYFSDCDQNSVYLAGPDCHLVGCVSRRSGRVGFFVAGNSNRLLNCKSFLSGRLDASNGSGFNVANVSRIDLTHCEAQDNRQHGFALNNTNQSVMAACRSDRNGLGAEPITTGWNGDGLFMAGSTECRIDFVGGDRNTGTRYQRWTYNCGASNNNNILTIVCGTGGDGTKGGNGSFGTGSVGWVRWNGGNAAGAFA